MAHDDRHRYVEPLRGDGAISGVLGLAIDVTHEEKAKARLQMLMSAVEQSPSMVVVTTPDEIIQYVNHRFTEITGYAREEVIGSTATFLVDPLPSEQYASLKDTLQRGQVWRGEFLARKKLGARYWESATIAALVDGHGRVVHYLKIAEDITLRKLQEQSLASTLESERARAQKLSRLNVLLAEEARRAHERQRELLHRLLTVQETERRRLARGLHDEIGQALTGLKLSLESIAAPGDEKVDNALRDTKAMVIELSRSVRDLSLDLRPAILDDFGLLPGLRWLFGRYQAHTRVRVQLHHDGLDGRLRAEVETAAYRIVQEALSNVARHAGVAEAAVTLRMDGHRLLLRVEDHGSGFAVEKTGPSTGGLSGMNEWAASVGGRLRIESAPGTGTRVIAGLPVHEAPRVRGTSDGDHENPPR